MPHATLLKFGFPETCVFEGNHWTLLVRPAQVTLGSLVLCANADARAYSELPIEAFEEQARLVRLIERLLRAAVDYERLNYLMLMMVDPHVHFHVLPRYQGTRGYNGHQFFDSGWPGLPDLARSSPIPAGFVAHLKELLSGLTDGC